MPSVLCLTRQGLPTLRDGGDPANMTAMGGYLIREPARKRDVTLMASGSEVAIAVEAAEMLGAEGIAAAVASIPCFELFDAQPPAFRKAVLNAAPRIAVEAAVRDSWNRYLREGDVFVGMTGFGASAPADALYRHFGITADAVAEAARRIVHDSRETV
jgi:transketolase